MRPALLGPAPRERAAGREPREGSQPASEPEELRELAKQLRRLAGQSPLPDIEADLLDLAARFERMAADLEAQRRLGSAPKRGKA